MRELTVRVTDEPDLPEVVAHLAERSITNVPGNAQVVLSQSLWFSPRVVTETATWCHVNQHDNLGTWGETGETRPPGNLTSLVFAPFDFALEGVFEGLLPLGLTVIAAGLLKLLNRLGLIG